MASYSSSAWKLQPQASHDEVDSWFDEGGRLVRVAEMRKALFRVGVDPSCRHRLWKYLFGIYEPSFTYREQGIVDLEDRVQYDALRRRWKALDDVISLTKDDLYSSPPYMAESDEEAESEGTQSLSRTSSQLSGKKSLSDGPLDDSSFCVLSPPDPPKGATKPTKMTNGSLSDVGCSKLNGTTGGSDPGATIGTVDKTGSTLDPALGGNKPFTRSNGVCSNDHHGDDPLDTGVDKISNSDVITNGLVDKNSNGDVVRNGLVDKNSNSDITWKGNKSSVNGGMGDVPGAIATREI